jgi:hypothetical protein
MIKISYFKFKQYFKDTKFDIAKADDYYDEFYLYADNITDTFLIDLKTPVSFNNNHNIYDIMLWLSKEENQKKAFVSKYVHLPLPRILPKKEIKNKTYHIEKKSPGLKFTKDELVETISVIKDKLRVEKKKSISFNKKLKV